MPLTDNEKIRVHPRSSNDWRAAVPIKKRRFLFTRSPSPPPESSVPTDGAVPEKKPESSDLGFSSSNAGGDSSQANIVKNNVPSCESCNLQPPTPVDLGIEEKMTGSSELRSPLASTTGTPTQVNVVTSHISCSGPHRLSSPAPEKCFVAEQKHEFPKGSFSFGAAGSYPVHVNTVAGESASNEASGSLAAETDHDLCEKKLNSPDVGSSFTNNGVNSACVNAATGKNVTSVELQSPTHVLSNALDTKSEPLHREIHFSEKGGMPTQVSSVTWNSESSQEPTSRDMSICPKTEILPALNDQGSGLNLALNRNFAVWAASGSEVISSATKETCAMPTEGKLIPREGVFVSKEAPELQNLQTTFRDTTLTLDSSHLCPNRSNWDLNTTMDAWEGPSADSLLNCGAADYGRQDLGDITDKRLGLGVKLILHKEPNHGDMAQENYLLQENNHMNKLINPCPSIVDSNLDACLDLQLRPFSSPNLGNMSGEHDSNREQSFLSLGVKPMVSTSGLPLAAGRTVKSEPIETDDKVTGKVDSGVMKSLSLKHAKSEPCEGQTSKTTCPGKMNLTCSRDVKREPLGDQSQGDVRCPETSLFPMGEKIHSLEPRNAQMHQKSSKKDDKVLIHASKPLVLNNVMHPCADKSMNIPIDSSDVVLSMNIPNDSSHVVLSMNIPNDSSHVVLSMNIPNDSSDVVDGDPALVNQASASATNMSIGTVTTQCSSGIVAVPSALLSEPMISDGNDISSLPETCETSTLPMALPPDSLNSNDGHDPSEGAPGVIAHMDNLNSHDSSNASLTESVLGKPHESRMVVNADEIGNKPGVLSEAREGLSDATCKSDSSHVAARAINTVSRLCGTYAEDFEDGEVRCPALDATGEGSSGVTEEQEGKAVESNSSVDVPVLAPLLADEGINVDTPKEADILCSKECGGGGPVESKVKPCSSSTDAPTSDFGNRNLSKIIRRTLKDQRKDGTGLERKLKSSDLCTKVSPLGNKSDAANSEQPTAEGPILVQKHVLAETEPSEKEGSKTDTSDKGSCRKIIYLNSVSANRKSTLDRPISWQGARERAVGRSYRRERLHSHGSRDESCKDRSQKGEGERHYGFPVEKYRSDLHIRSRTDKQNTLHSDRNFNPDHISEQTNGSNGIIFSRPVGTGGEAAVGTLSHGSKRLPRKLSTEEMQNQSRVPGRRWSPGAQVRVPFGRQSIREISPGRCIQRNIPDFAHLAHEEKFMRDLPENMGERSMHSHPHSQYERAEGILLHGERSLSPQRRHIGPLQIPPNCPESSPSSQRRPSHQWSPPRRTSNGFSGARGLGRYRSPPIGRINRVQSPHERPCFPEDMIVRRRGSPPYIAQLPNDMMDVGPLREYGLPRGSDRNIRRFNMIDPREMMEEEYVGPAFARSQMREFVGDDEFVDARRGNERGGPVYPFRQRYIAGDNEGERFQFQVEDGPSRQLRLRSDASEGFPEGSSPRDFEMRFRNRLGHPSGRLRGTDQEQEDDYGHRGDEWHDSGSSGGRTKRRRF